MKRLLFTSIAVSALIAPAIAADIAQIYQSLQPPPGLLWTWTGLYLGANGGWIDSTGPGDITNTGTDTSTLGLGTLLTNGKIPRLINLNIGGALGGGQIGYNWEIGRTWMLGIEADWDGKGGGGNSTGSDLGAGKTFGLVSMIYNRQLDALGTVRGRLGYLLAPDQLWYVTGGLAYGETKFGSSFICPGCKPPSGTEGSTSIQTSTVSAGWALGPGIEWKFLPGWSIKAEYLYVDLGNPSNTIKYTYAKNVSTLTSTTNERDNVVRIGINYKLF
jgi:outer membrane immunogenic protein